MKRLSRTLPFLAAAAATAATTQAEPVNLSGIYPHLAYYNNEGECGTGAVVPWADRLWVITYAPHMPKGSSDKLYEITRDLAVTVRPESIGGTPANRMIHEESRQLFIGPYAVDADRNVRVIPYTTMYGRHTGNARHLTDPAGKIYYATMEEGVYEVDVSTLAVTELWRDEQVKDGRKADLPGYHGKGLFSGQGRLVYANNGDHAAQARSKPDVPSGVLAEWDGKAEAWTVVQRNQFTEVTGPGGITGNKNPATDPLWSVGWDHRSLILKALDKGVWHTWRLPKGSHSYDGAHGWNTEWPRIREIGETDLLMTMHGTFWNFPATFTAANSAGISPRSNYLKVIGDFARWGERVVFGCDDTAKSEFLNKRKAKGEIAAPQSHSNLWFVEPARLDHLGPVIGRGAVWAQEPVKAGTPSEAFLFAGYDHRVLHLVSGETSPVTFTLEVDRAGNGTWSKLRDVEVAGKAWVAFAAADAGVWIRVTAGRDLTKASAVFSYRNLDARGTANDPIFAGLAGAADTKITGGIVRSMGGDRRMLAMAAMTPGGAPANYLLDENLRLTAADEPESLETSIKKAAIVQGALKVDAASVVYVDDGGRRWRLPRGDAAFDTAGPLGDGRVVREVATERDLFNAHGTFYELPAENAGGFSKVRPVATHNLRVHDYCSYRGLFIMTGLVSQPQPGNPHVIVSDDGRAALWAGAIDDIWKMGKPRGAGGPWKDSAVKAGDVSDPYLMTAYDRKSVTLGQTGAATANLTLEVDITGSGLWVPYQTFAVAGGKTVEHTFDPAFSAYWIRARTDAACSATVWLTYE